jgi:TIR domain
VTVFISYARADTSCAQELHALLRTAGWRVWLDVEDVAAGVNWHEAVTRAIEQADTFVFVLSPSSLNSVWCARELEVAVARGKKIVALVARDPHGSAVPDALARVSWIRTRTDDDRVGACRSLISAIAAATV